MAGMMARARSRERYECNMNEERKNIMNGITFSFFSFGHVEYVNWSVYLSLLFSCCLLFWPLFLGRYIVWQIIYIHSHLHM